MYVDINRTQTNPSYKPWADEVRDVDEESDEVYHAYSTGTLQLAPRHAVHLSSSRRPGEIDGIVASKSKMYHRAFEVQILLKVLQAAKYLVNGCKLAGRDCFLWLLCSAEMLL